MGKPGELIARGPQVMKGYWNNPDETAQVLRDGWLWTGDVAEMDADGFMRIVDRKKDMILVSGFNVYPNEVEEVVAAPRRRGRGGRHRRPRREVRRGGEGGGGEEATPTSPPRR